MPLFVIQSIFVPPWDLTNAFPRTGVPIMPDLHVLVCGGRDYADAATLARVLDALHAEQGPIVEIIHGAARGADTLAAGWARSRGIPIAAYPADWKRHPRAAGPIRNQQMLAEGRPDLVVAFAGGAGTADMVRRSRAANVRVIEPHRDMRAPAPPGQLNL